jgi:dynactin 1
VGVILDAAEGKNDGSVAGVRYFDCETNCGLFVKRAQVKLDRDSGAAQSVKDARSTETAPVQSVPSEEATSHSDRLAALRKKRQSLLGSEAKPTQQPETSITAVGQ